MNRTARMPAVDLQIKPVSEIPALDEDLTFRKPAPPSSKEATGKKPMSEAKKAQLAAAREKSAVKRKANAEAKRLAKAAEKEASKRDRAEFLAAKKAARAGNIPEPAPAAPTPLSPVPEQPAPPAPEPVPAAPSLDKVVSKPVSAPGWDYDLLADKVATRMTSGKEQRRAAKAAKALTEAEIRASEREKVLGTLRDIAVQHPNKRGHPAPYNSYTQPPPARTPVPAPVNLLRRPAAGEPDWAACFRGGNR